MKNITKLLSILALVATVSYKTAHADLQAVREYQAEQNAGGQRAMAPRERTAPAGSTEFDAKITALIDERQQLNQQIRSKSSELAAKNSEINQINSRIQGLNKEIEAADAWYARTRDPKWLAGKNLQTQAKQAAEQELATAKSKFATLEREKEQLQQQLQKTKTDLKDVQKQKAQQRRPQRQAQPQPQVQEQPRTSTSQAREPQRGLSYGEQVSNINNMFRDKIQNLKALYQNNRIGEAEYKQQKAAIEKWYRDQLTALKSQPRR